jgi:hypothetical protein
MLTHPLVAVFGTFSRLFQAGSSSGDLRPTPDFLLASRETPDDLGTVLAKNGNITTYTKLIKVSFGMANDRGGYADTISEQHRLLASAAEPKGCDGRQDPSLRLPDSQRAAGI